MGRSNSFENTHSPQIIERLLREVADAGIGVMLLRAWLEEKFGANTKEYVQANSFLRKQEPFNRNALQYLRDIEEELAENSVIGIRTLRHMEMVYARREQQQANLAERIKVAREAGNIVSYMDYKALKASKAGAAIEPKGA